jgi:hypothetical protein
MVSLIMDASPNDILLWGLISIAVAIIAIGIPALYYYNKRQRDSDNIKLLKSIDLKPWVHLRYIVAITVVSGIVLMGASMFVHTQSNTNATIQLLYLYLG